MNKMRILLVSIFCGFTMVLFGQSVEQLIETAIERNPGLKAMELEYQAALQKSDQVLDYPDPTVSVGIGILPVETRLGAQVLRFGVSQAVPWKGLLSGRSDVLKAQAEILSAKDELRAIDIAFAIRSTYTQLVWLERRKAIIIRKLALIDALEDLSKSAVRSGKGKLSNVLLVQRMRELLEANLTQLEKRKEAPTVILNRWIGESLDNTIEIIDDVSIPEELNPYINFANQEHPQLLMLEKQIDASKMRSKLTELESKPQIALGLDYAIIDGRSDVQIPNNGRDVFIPMGKIKIPIHTKRFESQRQEEVLKQLMLAERKNDVVELFHAEIIKAQADIDYERSEILKFEQLKIITTETIDLMRAEYASEGTRFEELLRLELELIDYDDAILKSRYIQELAAATILKFQ